MTVRRELVLESFGYGPNYRGAFGSVPTSGPTPLPAPTLLPASPAVPTAMPAPRDPYDYAAQSLLDATARITAFNATLDRVMAATRSLNALRASRYAGALEMSPANIERRTYFMPLVGREPCPPAGALSYAWEDIFDSARENLRQLAANPPPRYVAADRVLTWSLAIRWNWYLLIDATNIRTIFLFSNEYAATHAVLTATGGTAPVGGRDEVHQDLLDPAYAAIIAATGPQQTPGNQLGGWPNTTYGQYPNIDTRIVQHYQGGTVPAPGGPIGATNVTTGQSFPRELETQLHDIAQWFVTLRPQPGYFYDARDYVFRRGPTRLYTRPDGSTGTQDISWDVGAWIRSLGALARFGAGLSFSRVILDAIGFYVVNHITWWQNQGYTSLNSDEVRRAQRDAMSAAFRNNALNQIIAGTTIAVVSAINPAMGAVAAAVAQIGNWMIDEFVIKSLDQDAPRSLFVRVPADPLCLPRSTTEEGERAALAINPRRFMLPLSLTTRLGVPRRPGDPPPPPESSSGGGGAVVAGGLVLFWMLARAMR